MKNKYEKYRGTMDMIKLILYVAFVLDPCSKMKALVFWLRKCNGLVLANQIEIKVRDFLNHLIGQYNKFQGGSSNIVVDIGRSNVNPLNVRSDGSKKDRMRQFRKIFSQHLVA
jgi:hypothetical protein